MCLNPSGGNNEACIKGWLTCKYLDNGKRRVFDPIRLYGVGAGLGGPFGGWIDDVFGW
jgi:hypothetical protein